MEAGFQLRERLAIYPEFARDGGFVDARLTRPMADHLGQDFYAKEEP